MSPWDRIVPGVLLRVTAAALAWLLLHLLEVV